jgi:hypothetical protein
MASDFAEGLAVSALTFAAPMIATKAWKYIKKYPYLGLALGTYLTGAYVNTIDIGGSERDAHGMGKHAAQLLAGVQVLHKLKDSKFWKGICDYITNNKSTQYKWGEQVAPLPNLQAYSSDDVCTPIDGVYKEYLEWTKQRLLSHIDYTSVNERYLTLLAYVFTSNEIRSNQGKDFGNLNVRLGFVHETSVIIKDGVLKDLCSFPFNDVDESIAWVKTLDKLEYFKTLDSQAQRIAVCTLDNASSNVQTDTGEVVLTKDDLISLTSLSIDDKPSLTKQVAQTRYMAPLVGKKLELHQTPKITLPEGFEAYNWILNAYFGDKKLYQKFLPSYKMCKDFVTRVVADLDEDTKVECMSNLVRLVSNTVPVLDVENQRVWNLELSLPSAYHREQVPEALRGADVTTTTHRVIVESEKIIVANTVRCATYKAKEGQDNQLLLGQAILLRVLYVIKVLLLVTKADFFSFNKNSFAQIAECDITSSLADIKYDPEVLQVYTELDLNYPRTKLDDNMFDSSAAPQTTTYTSHLKHYVPKLLSVSSIDELNRVVDAMTNGEHAIKTLLDNEVAQKIKQKDNQTDKDILERLANYIGTLRQSESPPNEGMPDLTNLAKFVNIATLTSLRENENRLTYALRVVYVCCNACTVLGTESDFGKSVVFKAPRYDVTELTWFTTQHEHDVRMRDQKYRHEDIETRSIKIKGELHTVGRRITNSRHAIEHERFKAAINTIYKDDDAKPEPFSSFGYVVYFVRWLASVVASIGQFDALSDGNYIDLLIKEEASNVVFEFSIKQVSNTNTMVSDSQISCVNFSTKYRSPPPNDTPEEDRVKLSMDQLPFVVAYTPSNTTNVFYYYACQKNIPLQMTPSFVGTSANKAHEVWLDKIGFADVVLYRLAHGIDGAQGGGLGLCVYIDNMANLMTSQLDKTNKEDVELLACYKMMDIPSFSCQFEALPLFDNYYSKLNGQGVETLKQEVKALVQPSIDKNILVFLQQVMLWSLTGNFALPNVSQDKAYLDKSREARKTLSGGHPLDTTKSYTDIANKRYACYPAQALQADTKGNKQPYPFLLGSQPLITNLMGFMLVTVNIDPKVAIHVLDMFWEYNKRNEGNLESFREKWKGINSSGVASSVDVVDTLKKLGLVVAYKPTTMLSKEQAGQAKTQKQNQAHRESKEQRQRQENEYLSKTNAPNGVDARTWQAVLDNGFENLYRSVANFNTTDEDAKRSLLNHIGVAAINKPPFAHDKNKWKAYDYVFQANPGLFYLAGNKWVPLNSLQAQEHAAKKGGNLGQNVNHQGYNQGLNQGLNQGGIGAIPGAGLAGLGAAAMHGQSAFHHGNRNILQNQQQQQQQLPKGQVTFTNHTTQGQIVHATVNTASEVQDDADKRIKRVYADKLSNRARNVTFTDSQGRTVFTLLPHNILAIVLLLVYAVMTIYASSIGTSTYTLLNSVNKQDSSYAANLPALQKPRMACSTFFGIGVGMVVAFVVSLVEIVNNTRLRQALFIVLMAAPIIVLGAMGVSGASDVCGTNSMTDSTNPTINNALTTSPQSASPVGQKRKRGTFEQKMPRVANFFKSVLGTHDSDLDGSALLGDAPSCTPGGGPNVCSSDMKTSCTKDTPCASGVCLTGTCNNDPSAPCVTTLDCIDDVTRNNMKASDFFFIGIGLGVLLAGLCTLMPGNPFHPDVHDTMHGLVKQKDFSVSSQIKRHWLIYFGLFSLVLLGGAASSLWLGSATPPAKTEDAKAGETIQGPANAQAGVMIALSVVIFLAIAFGGYLHRKRHTKLALEVQSSGILHGTATASTVVLGQPASK